MRKEENSLRTVPKQPEVHRRRRPIPSTTPEGRESQLISAAIDLAEEQLLNGTASAQVITHYLKLGTERERRENLLLQKQIELAEAKVESLKSARRVEELYADAIKAMKRYSGHGDEDAEDIQ